MIFWHSAGAKNHVCNCCFSKHFFQEDIGHVVLPDLTDFFDRKVSKVSLIFVIVITSVFKCRNDFQLLSLQKLPGGAATSYKVVFQLLSEKFGGLWLGQKKSQHVMLRILFN